MARDRDVRRDRAGHGPDPAESRRGLVSIDAVDGFEIAKGEPDPRGWEVRTLSDRELGSVDDLLIDPDRGEVVMLALSLHGDDIRSQVPIRSVQLDRGRRVVLVDSADVQHGSSRGVAEPVRDSRRNETRHEEQRRDEEVRREEERVVMADDRPRVERSDVAADGTEERVVERRPYVEEVVVRRRPVE